MNETAGPAAAVPASSLMKTLRVLGIDGWVLLALVLLVNIPLLSGFVGAGWIYFPSGVQASPWWTLLTHPLVHVSVYHLLLDAAAFFLLYAMLRSSPFERIAILACSVAGSVILARLLASDLARTGLCGLSGVGHGLMAVVSLQTLAAARSDPRGRVWALISLGVLAAKCILEAVTGSVVFHQFHLGYLGSPVAACHLGGALGGTVVWTVSELRGRLHAAFVSEAGANA